MKYIDEYRDADKVARLAETIKRSSKKPVKLMEFCGGHTVAIMKNGIRQLLPETITMLSGPGCPVCVTAGADIDKAIAMAQIPNVIITTFGDLIKVPGSYSSLQEARAGGADIRIVYSTIDALKIAVENPSRPIIFLGIGFETTAPTVAAAITGAETKDVRNFFVFSMLKICPPVIRALLNLGEIKLDGIIAPGHVSAVIGTKPYAFISRDYGIACVVSGFETLDILLAVAMLVNQIESGKPSIESGYRRGVREDGNQQALALMEHVFDIGAAEWRGIGPLDSSGLKLNEQYRAFDAEYRFEIAVPPPKEIKGCICGDILRGIRTPADCSLFARVCIPEKPVGPCMVSSKGSCAAWYSYGEIHG